MQRTELLFAHWAAKFLVSARGPRWKKLVQHVLELPETHPDALAFQLLMIRANGCVNCDARKYVERGGCGRCSLTTLEFSKDDDSQLLERWRSNRKEIDKALRASKTTLAKAA